MNLRQQVPEKIGKYDVLDVLGKGSMGVVYKGHDAYVDRPVAIKVATYMQEVKSLQGQLSGEAAGGGEDPLVALKKQELDQRAAAD